MPPLSLSHLKAANMDIHVTPQNALLGVSVVSVQQSKAMGSKGAGSYSAPKDDPV